MSNSFYPGWKVYTDNPENAEFTHKASEGAYIGDLAWWDSNNNVLRSALQFADSGSALATQQLFAAAFAGVFASSQLSTDATARNARVMIDQIREYPCASATFNPGDYVTATYSAGLAAQSVTKTSDPSLAIGRVVKQYTSATTLVKVRLTSTLFLGRLMGLTNAAAMASITGGITPFPITGQAPLSATSAGGAVTITGGIGGATSGTGGASSLIGGAGTGVTAVGGASNQTGGVGGAGGTSTGGAGGAIVDVGGVGGSATTGTGGAGGAASLTGGAGGASSGTSGTAGAGGTLTISAGGGGASAGTTSTGGAGGNVNIVPGAGGAGTSTTGANGAIQFNGHGLVTTLAQTGAPSATNAVILLATRAYKIAACSCFFNATAGGTSTLDVTHETTTGAPGSGTTILNATFNLNATGNTVQNGALTTGSNLLVAVGDRISTKWNNAIQSTTGLCVALELLPQ